MGPGLARTWPPIFTQAVLALAVMLITRRLNVVLGEPSWLAAAISADSRSWDASGRDVDRPAGSADL